MIGEASVSLCLLKGEYGGKNTKYKRDIKNWGYREGLAY